MVIYKPLHIGEQAWKKRLEAGEGNTGKRWIVADKNTCNTQIHIRNTAGRPGYSSQQCKTGIVNGMF